MDAALGRRPDFYSCPWTPSARRFPMEINTWWMHARCQSQLGSELARIGSTQRQAGSSKSINHLVSQSVRASGQVGGKQSISLVGSASQ